MDRMRLDEPPSDGYFLYLLDTDSAAVAAATAECLAVPPERIYIADGAPARDSVVLPLVHIEQREHDVEFSAGREFGRLIDGASELAVALLLCRATGASAMLSAPGLTPNQWVLVTAEGGHGLVMVDGDAADDGRWEILFTYEPITGASELPVRSA